MFRKIIWQLTFSYLLVILFSMGIMGFFLYTTIESHFINNLESTLLLNAQLVSKFWESSFYEPLSMPEKERRDRMTERLAWQSVSRIRIIDSGRDVQLDTGQHPGEPLENSEQIVRALHGEESVEIVHQGEFGTSPVLSIAYPIKIIKGKSGDEQVVGVVYTTRSLAYVKEILGSLRMEYGVGIFFSLVALGFLSFFISAYISKPIIEITRAAEKITQGDLTYRVPRRRKDEIGELARRFDFMREKLRHALGELLEEKNKLSAVLTTMADGVLVFDREGNLMLINSAARDLLGGIEPSRASEKVKQDEPPFSELRKILEEALASGCEGTEVVSGFSNNRIAEVNFSSLYAGNNEFLGLVMVLHDITELRRLDEMKTEFVTNVSHELKTPLASIKGFTELLLDGALEERENSRKFLLSIYKEADRLARMVRSLLDLSRMESGLIKMDINDLDIAAVASGVIEKLSLQAKDLGVNMVTRFTSTPVVRGNSDRVEQVLINLLDNALRYSPASSTISVEISGSDGFAEIRVCDEGPGLSEEDQERVFERFYRVDKARSRDHGGSGLGLAITRQIIENLGGKIWVKSSPGEGCCFAFTLPCANSDHARSE